METYIIICKIINGNLLFYLRKLRLGLCINLEGWDGKGDGREVQKGGDIYTYVWFMLRFDRKQQNSVKAIILQLKNKLILKNDSHLLHCRWIPYHWATWEAQEQFTEEYKTNSLFEQLRLVLYVVLRWGLIPGWGRSPGGGHSKPLRYSCLENPMDRGA